MHQAIMRPSRSLVRAGGGSLPNVLHHRARRSSLSRDRRFSTTTSFWAVGAERANMRWRGHAARRARWCKTFGKEPPPALTKDLLGRMIAWRIQEKFYGGHDKATIKLLDGLVW